MFGKVILSKATGLFKSFVEIEWFQDLNTTQMAIWAAQLKVYSTIRTFGQKQIETNMKNHNDK